MKCKNGIFVSVFLVAVILTGCGPSLESTFQKDWSVDRELGNYNLTYLTPEGTHLITGTQKNVDVLNAIDGEPLWSTREDFEGRILRATTFTAFGATVGGGELQAQYLKYHLLDEAGIALIFDHRLGNEIVAGVDIHSGEELWSTQNYSYSIEKYSPLIDRVAEEAGGLLARALGGEVEKEPREERMHREIQFIDNLILPLYGQEAFLFKTFDGLVCIETETGHERWRIEDFSGPGLNDVIYINDQEILVVSSDAGIFGRMMQTHHLARVNVESGELIWLEEHNGNEIEWVYLYNDKIILDASPLQVFDLASGEKLWENNVHKSGMYYPPPVLDDNTVYIAGNTLRENVRAIQVGVPITIKKHDLQTGEILWSTDESRSTIADMILYDGMLFVSGSGGDMFDGSGGLITLDASNGERVWQSDSFDGVGFGRWGAEASYIIFDDRANVIVSGPNNIYSFDYQTGDVKYTIDHRENDVGRIGYLVDFNNSVVAISRNGLAAYSKDDGTLLFTQETHNVDSYELIGDRLFVYQHNRAVSAIDIDTGELLGIITYRPSDEVSFGNLYDGVYVTARGDAILVYDRSKRLSRFRVD